MGPPPIHAGRSLGWSRNGSRTRRAGTDSEPTTSDSGSGVPQVWCHMADFTISSGDFIRPYRTPAEVLSAPESTNQVFRFGDVVQLDKGVSTSAHRVARASTSGSTCISTSILGIAGNAASSVVDTQLSVFAASNRNEFWARTRGGLLAGATVGAYYGLFRDSSKNVWLVDLGNTQSTSLRVQVTGLLDAIGDSGGAVTMKFGLPAGSTNTFGLNQ